MMCKVLTYSLTLLTIVAGLFVMSACQKEDVGKSEVMMTFNTRAIVSDKVSDTDELERMNDLRVIMVRQDGTVVDNHLAEGINASSVKFTFSTPVKTGGEYFTFYAVANENALTPVPSWMKTCQRNVELTEQNITAIKIQEIGDGGAFTIPNEQAIPQTKIWTVYVPQQDKYAVPDPLQLEYVASKISVKFVNQTNESQSLSNIRITGITPNTQGYLFKQDGTDYIDSKDNNATSISWGKVLTLAAPTTGDKGETIYASDSVAYYTYPLAEGNFNFPMLYATWGDETEPRTLDLSGITSLKRNEHLRIEITLTPAGDITVNYTIAPWEDTPTNIGGEAPTTPGNGYYVDAWGTGGIIDVGGGEAGENDWTLSDGTIIKGEQIQEDWTAFASDQNDQLRVYIPNDKLVVGNRVVLDFRCAYDNCDKGQNFKIRFSTDQYSEQSIESTDSAEDDTYVYEGGTTHVRYLTLTESVIGKLHKPDWGAPNNQNDNYKVLILLTYDVNCEGAHKFGVTITKFGLITPRSATQ